MRVLLVCGSRAWTDRAACRYWLRRIVSRHGLDVLLVHGDNGYDAEGRSLMGRPLGGTHRGADRLAAEEWEALGGRTQAYPANWTRYGKAAGMRRNRDMFDASKPDMGLAFHFEALPAGGTGGMLGILHQHRVPAYVARSVEECRPYAPEEDLFDGA